MRPGFWCRYSGPLNAEFLTAPRSLCFCVWPADHSVSNHHAAPRIAFARSSAFAASPGAPLAEPSAHLPVGLGFAICQQARQTARPNRVRYPTDWSFTSGCSPPPFTRTQLPSITGSNVGLKRTCTSLTKHNHRRTATGILPVLIADRLSIFPTAASRLVSLTLPTRERSVLVSAHQHHGVFVHEDRLRSRILRRARRVAWASAR